MKLRVVTCIWGTAWERYGQVFEDSFRKHWPRDVELVVVTDRDLPLSRGRAIDLREMYGFLAFKERYGQSKTANGYDAPEGTKVTETGYSWRHDAVKWMPQGLSSAEAMVDLDDGDVLIWLDADVETIAPVPSGWMDTILGVADVACLQRNNTHSEIGFHAERVGPGTRAFVEKFADFYASGEVFTLRETHSAFVFDRSLELFPDLVVNNLNIGGGKGHVFPKSLLSQCLIHRKGERKNILEKH